MTIDLNKTYRTRDGCKVKIFMIDGGGDYPVKGVWAEEEGVWCTDAWTPDGRASSSGDDSPNDLVETAGFVTVDVWLNVYKQGAKVHGNREAAEQQATPDRLACIHIKREVEIGEGLI